MVGSFVTTHGTWMAAGSSADPSQTRPITADDQARDRPSTLPGHGPTRTQRKQLLKLEHYGRRQEHMLLSIRSNQSPPAATVASPDDRDPKQWGATGPPSQTIAQDSPHCLGSRQDSQGLLLR